MFGLSSRLTYLLEDQPRLCTYARYSRPWKEPSSSTSITDVVTAVFKSQLGLASVFDDDSWPHFEPRRPLATRQAVFDWFLLHG